MFSTFWLVTLMVIIAVLVAVYVYYRKPAVTPPTFTPTVWTPPTWTPVPTWPDEVPPEDPTKKDIVEPILLATAAPIANIAPIKKSVPDAAIAPVKAKKATAGKRVTQKSATQDAKGSRRTTKTTKPVSSKW